MSRISPVHNLSYRHLGYKKEPQYSINPVVTNITHEMNSAHGFMKTVTIEVIVPGPDFDNKAVLQAIKDKFEFLEPKKETIHKTLENLINRYRIK